MRSQYSASSMKWVVTMTVTPRFGQGGDAPPELAARQRIGAAGRLVEEQDLGLVQQGGGHRQALLEAAGQLAAGEARQRFELELLAATVDALARLRCRAGRRRRRRTRRFSVTDSSP